MSGRWYRLAVTAGSILFAAGVAGIIWTAWLIWRPAPPPAASAAPAPARQATPFQPNAPTATVPPPTPTPLPAGAPEAPREGAFDWLQDAEESGKVRLVIQPPAGVNGGREIKSRFIRVFELFVRHGAGLPEHAPRRAGDPVDHPLGAGRGGRGAARRGGGHGAEHGLLLAGAHPAQHGRAGGLAGAIAAASRERATTWNWRRWCACRPPGWRRTSSSPSTRPWRRRRRITRGWQMCWTRAEDWLVFEICGWQLPGEAWYPGVTPSTGSIYLGFIRVR